VRFAVCCIFWLSIVYAAILRHDGNLFDPAWRSSVASAVPKAGRAVGSRLVLGLAPYCRADPSACLASATRLNRLLEASGDDETDEARAATGLRGPERRIRGAMTVVTP